MLTTNIMERCLTTLLQNKDEESIEYLCKLLISVDKELKTAKCDLNGFFMTMEEIVDKKHGMISSRVQLMLQDVIDLHNGKLLTEKFRNLTPFVKDVPKPMKTTPEELDETDRISNEKLVPAKNEANTKANIENNDSTAEIKPPELPYKSDQCSPLNQDGKKIYDKEFLLALRYYSTCKKRPDNIPTKLTPDDKAAYVNQSQVRRAAPPYYPRPPPQPGQTPRMSGSHRQARPIYPQQPSKFVPMATGPVQMYVNAVPYSTAPRPQAGYQHTFQMIPNQKIAYPPLVQTQTQPQTTYFYNNQIALQRLGSPPSQVQSQSPNNTQSPQATITINPTVTQQQNIPPKYNRRRAIAIPIIDPTTGKDKLNEMYEQDESHPACGESSARQTPQPPPSNPSKEVQAAFAKQVAQAISNDQQTDELEQLDHI